MLQPGFEGPWLSVGRKNGSDELFALAEAGAAQ